MNVTTALALCLGLVTLVALSHRVELADGARWWRVLVPSWRFFEAPDVRFTLLARAVAGAAADCLGFAELPPPVARSVSSWLYAPDSNLKLACHDLIETLVSELAEQGAIELEAAQQLVSYQLVQHMTAFFLRQQAPTASHYQFKLQAHAPDGSVEALFLSPLYALS